MKKRILDVASQLFETRSIQGSGIDTIIEKSGVAKATLYRHFPSKDLLIIAFLRDRADTLYQAFKEGLTGKDQPYDRLIELCCLLEKWITTSELKGLPSYIASVEFPDPSHPVNQFSAQLAQELQGYLAAIAAQAGAGDAELLAQQLIMLFEGASLVERLTPGSGAARKAKNAALTIIKASV